ncbi:KRAB-A domain-containing protein 2-like [Thrips palmi]|uniref:KRAB-A domain-containing protein 2-like n=1 Tax=Thrips palmi TaxID=161013 RepID=A0A6P8ZNT8_THRPL|nr:KRAB-A domain-containing protein 2-like [Thrips palmi]
MASSKEKFELAIQKMISATKGKNSKFLTPQAYDKLIQEVKEAKIKKTKKTTKDYRRLAKYAVIEIDGEEKLIVPLKGASQPRFYVHTEDLYEACREIHEATGHGGRDKMKYDSKEGKYVNLSQKMLLCFKENCEQCLLKESTQKKGVTVRPIIHKEMNARAQVDLIDMQTSADGDFRFIMVLQDHLTKFVHLRPIRRKKAEHVAVELVPIFLEFGAPSILQSDNGREFANAIINSLQEMWPELKIVHGTPRHSQSQGSVERANRDVQDILITWMRDHNTTSWSEGLKFVANMKNRRHHQGIGRSPYEALFGVPMKVGLGTSFPLHLIGKLEREESLEVRQALNGNLLTTVAITNQVPTSRTSFGTWG